MIVPRGPRVKDPLKSIRFGEERVTVMQMTPLEAIADPVRLKICRVLSERGTATLDQLTEQVGAHFNTIRTHVKALEDAGLLCRFDRDLREGPGRPQQTWRLREGWSVPTGDFLKLAEILAGFLLKIQADPKELQSFGANWGRYLAGRPGPKDVRQDLLSMLEQLGCSARIDGSRLILSSCPCPLISPENPPLICHLITAITRGFLDASGSELLLKEADHDPSRRVCTLTLKRHAV